MKEDSIKRKEIPGFVTHNTLFFWDVFNLLEKQKQPEPDGTVRESELKQALISSGKFNAGEAVQLVNDAIEQGLVKRLEFDVIGKNSSSNISKSDGK
jgi:hypothetical protein